MERLTPGMILGGKYRVERLLDEKTTGMVFEAVHVDLGRRVAIKVMGLDSSKSSDLAARFVSDAQTSASIDHPHLCEVLDIGKTDDGTPYWVMPLFRGVTLGNLFETHGRLSPKRIADIVGQTLSALEAAHAARIIHYDLNPTRVFVLNAYGGLSDFVKLLGLGIFRVLDQLKIAELTGSRTVLDTLCYMSPEQARGVEEIDPRANIFTMGAILYRGMTGLRPFSGNSYNELMYRIGTQPFPSPNSVTGVIVPAVEEVLLTAMARDPADRFASASDMRKALELAMLEQPEIGVSTMPPPQRSTMPPPLPDTIPTQHCSTLPPPLPSTSPWSPAEARPSTSTHVSHTSSAPPPMFYEASRGTSRPSNHDSRSEYSEYIIKERTTRRWPVWIGLAASLLLAVSGGYALVGNKLGTSAESDNQPAAGAILPAPEHEEKTAVTLKIEGAPQGASIFYDGLPVPNPFKVDRKETIAALKVEAAGFEPFITSLVPHSDSVVKVQLQPKRRDRHDRHSFAEQQEDKALKPQRKHEPLRSTSKTVDATRRAASFLFGQGGAKIGSDFD